MTEPRGSAWIRARRDELVAASQVRGREFGLALGALVDDTIAAVLSEVGSERVAVLALGSYARRELCPGSDLDILLLHDRRPDIAAVADALWYPFWDAGFVLGHATRTAKESIKLAESEMRPFTVPWMTRSSSPEISPSMTIELPMTVCAPFAYRPISPD